MQKRVCSLILYLRSQNSSKRLALSLGSLSSSALMSLCWVTKGYALSFCFLKSVFTHHMAELLYNLIFLLAFRFWYWFIFLSVSISCLFNSWICCCSSMWCCLTIIYFSCFEFSPPVDFGWKFSSADPEPPAAAPYFPALWSFFHFLFFSIHPPILCSLLCCCSFLHFLAWDCH